MSSTKIALALPLAFGIACSTTGQQARSHTGAMWTLYEPSDGSQESDRPPRGTGAEISTAPAVATAGAQDGLSIQPVAGSDTSSGSMGSTGSSGSSDSTGSTGSSDSTGSRGSPGPADPGSASGSRGTTDSPMGAIDPAPGSAKGSSDSAGPGETHGHADRGEHGAGDGMAHSDDQLLRGKVSKVSKEEISITPKGGEAKTLKIKPETTVTINGKDAKPTQLKQGQMVRASYSSQDGEDVAVKIEVGKARQGKPGASGRMKGHHGGAPGQGGAASPTGGDGTGRSGGSDSGMTGGSR